MRAKQSKRITRWGTSHSAIRGREATDELAELAGLTAGERVLDVGCGLGGTARYLAARFGVQMTGVDLTAEYCRVGNMLSDRTGLAERVELLTANARRCWDFTCFWARMPK